MSAPRPYANDSNEDFANKVLARFGALEDPNTPGFITDKSLRSIASGYHLDGRRATQDEMDLVREMQSRGGLFNSSTKVKQAPWMDASPGKIWVKCRTSSGP